MEIKKSKKLDVINDVWGDIKKVQKVKKIIIIRK